jgi:hypothetical protein
MPVAKRKVNPAHVQNYYARQGKGEPAQTMSDSIVNAAKTRAEKLASHRDAMASLMVSGGLCKSLGRE